MKFSIKKVHLFAFSFFIFIFICSIIYGFVATKVPHLIDSTQNNYKLLKGLSFFISILPGVFASSLVIGWSMDFGLNPENSLLRFSHAMFSRFKGVVITSLVIIFFLVLAWELILPSINYKIKNLEDLPSLLSEYQLSAQKMFNTQNYELAHFYAQQAEKIEPTNELTKRLLFKSELAMEKEVKISKSIQETMNELTFKNRDLVAINEKITPLNEPYESYKLMQIAKECKDNNDWFGAHYYSQQALRIADSKDININELKSISAEAWNNLSQSRMSRPSETEQIFAKKYEGYVSLINGDFLHAYYVFHTLSLQSKTISLDTDVQRYLKLSQEALNNQYFYYDETYNLQSHESFNNIYFCIENPDKTRSVFFIKGVTAKGKGAKLVQYLRGLSVINLDPDGIYMYGYYVPYAKMKAIETKIFSDNLLVELGISKNVKLIPYIQLNAVDRNLEGSLFMPEPLMETDTKNHIPGFLLLPITFEDFNYIKQASLGADAMSLSSLFSFIDRAEKFGFCAEALTFTFMNRVFQPLYILIIFVFLAWTSWYCKVKENTLFKFRWIFMFPLLCAAFIPMIKGIQGVFKSINYGILGKVGNEFALIVGLATYSIILFIVSFVFLSAKNEKDS